MVYVEMCDNDRWNKYEVANAPCARYGHRAIACGNKMIIFGGYNGVSRMNDMYEYDLEMRKWTEIIPKQGSAVPSGRDFYSAVLYKNRYFIIYAGGEGHKWLNDIWCYDLKHRKWNEIIPNNNNNHEGRAGHSAVLHENSMIVFGGWNGHKTLNDLFKFDLKSKMWSSVPHTGAIPLPRDSHTATLYNDNMIVIGGGDGKIRLNDMHVFNVKKSIWHKIQPEVNVGKAGHVACLLNDMLHIYSGGDGLLYSKYMYQYDLKKQKWYIINAKNENAGGGYCPSAVVYKNKIVHFGGSDGRNWSKAIHEFEACHTRDVQFTIMNMKYFSTQKIFSDIKIFCNSD